MDELIKLKLILAFTF